MMPFVTKLALVFVLRMILKIRYLPVLFLLLTISCKAKRFRFDYDWSDNAKGWFKYHAVPATWDEARLRCHAEGAVLASPLNNYLNEAIGSFVKSRSNSTNMQGYSIFSGVHCRFSKGDYTSVEGVPLLRLAITWAPGEPNNYDNSESCLAMTFLDGYGLMSDTRCESVLPYVCYKKKTNITITECGTTDPEYILERRTGSCYKFHTAGLVWSQAYMTCHAEGGYLAIINNDEEAEVIKIIISKHPASSVFASNEDILIGVHDWGHHGTSFMTIHGETLDVNYHNWSSEEPNNGTRARSGDIEEYCGVVFRSGLLNDNLCNSPMAFLCEKSPNSLL